MKIEQSFLRGVKAEELKWDKEKQQKNLAFGKRQHTGLCSQWFMLSKYSVESTGGCLKAQLHCGSDCVRGKVGALILLCDRTLSLPPLNIQNA